MVNRPTNAMAWAWAIVLGVALVLGNDVALAVHLEGAPLCRQPR